MRLDEQLQGYADKLLLKRHREIDADLEKNIETVVKQSTPPGSIRPGLLINGLVEVYIDRIRHLGHARMNSLITAFEDAEVALDKDILQEIKSQAIALCHLEQHRIFNAIPNVLPPGLRGQVSPIVDEVTKKRIVHDVDSIMADLSLELDIKSDKLSLAEKSKKLVYGAATGKRWDAFISHASEDKADFVRPLAAELEKSGLEVWFDETTLKVGDRLRESIDHGLSKSRFGIVVLSKNFFSKHWPKEELEGLSSKEISGVKVILPVWHNITQTEVAEQSPTLAGRFAAQSRDGLEKVVQQLREAMGKDRED
jgi:hypothetical protein